MGGRVAHIWERRVIYTFGEGKLRERGNLEGTNVDGSIILK